VCRKPPTHNKKCGRWGRNMATGQDISDLLSSILKTDETKNICHLAI
jgi:hypothetical protein